MMTTKWMNNESQDRQQLFEKQLVCEITVGAIILYLTERDQNADADEIADFVIGNFERIVASITNVDENNDENNDTQ